MVYVDSENEGTETEEGPFDGDPGAGMLPRRLTLLTVSLRSRFLLMLFSRKMK
jgi:hypothetical protein